MVARFRQAGHRCIGLDIDASVLRLAESQYGAGDWVHAKGEALPFAANTFRGVVSLYFAANLMDRDQFVAEASRVLSPGGRLAYTLVNPPVRILEAAQSRLRRGMPLDPSGLLSHRRGLGDPQSEWKRLCSAGLAPEVLLGPMWLPLLRRQPSRLAAAPVLRGLWTRMASDVIVRAMKPIGVDDAQVTGTEHRLMTALQHGVSDGIGGWSSVEAQDIGPGTYLIATPQGLLRARWLRQAPLEPTVAHWFQPESGPPHAVWPNAIIGRAASGVTAGLPVV